MAVTSIWAVKGWLGKVVIYVENPEKTDNPQCFEKAGMTHEQMQGLDDVIDYASQIIKTGIASERSEVMLRFVTGVNCDPDIAREEMMMIKKHYGKTDGVVAYHGYQSFGPSEATPEMAHEIGVKLAQRLWGERYQVLVCTHLDKANHLHNHFVLNNVSMIDGKKYYRSEHDYWLMQRESDALCREYGLSVVEETKRGKAKHYGEWNAENDGRQTWRSLVKSDVDAAIKQSMTERQFWDNMKKAGYEVKFGKDISVRPPGKERFVRLFRIFGEDYSIEGIRKRILAQTRPERIIIPPEPPPNKLRVIGHIHTVKKLKGYRALYFYYLYKMGVLPKKRRPNPKQVYFLFREDIRHMQNISKEIRLLCEYHIDTAEQLSSAKSNRTEQIISLSGTRKKLRYRARSIKDAETLASVKSEISVLSDKIGKLRREVKLCEDIEKRSGVFTDKLRRASSDQKKNIWKEKTRHEQFRGRR